MRTIKLLCLLMILGISSAAIAAELDNKAKLKLVNKHNTAVHIKSDLWVRDPYIILGPDDYYYLTGTMSEHDDPRQVSDRYNRGTGPGSIVGAKVQLWRSDNLVDWEYMGTPYTLEDTYEAIKTRKGKSKYLWASEFHWLGDRWAVVHCPHGVSALALSEGADINGKYTNMAPDVFIERHDPSLFKDDDGTIYLLSHCTRVAPIKEDFSGLKSEPVFIHPEGRKIGHEGATLRKIGNKYIQFGTAWSTDRTRSGSYNLYYCTADNIMGPYSERRFAGRFLGHGTPFVDKKGRWWCTAFYNSTVLPLDGEGIETRDLSDNAYTINDQGVTIVPLDVKIQPNGDVFIKAKDSRYGTAGPDEGKYTAENKKILNLKMGY